MNEIKLAVSQRLGLVVPEIEEQLKHLLTKSVLRVLDDVLGVHNLSECSIPAAPKGLAITGAAHSLLKAPQTANSIWLTAKTTPAKLSSPGGLVARSPRSLCSPLSLLSAPKALNALSVPATLSVPAIFPQDGSLAENQENVDAYIESELRDQGLQQTSGLRDRDVSLDDKKGESQLQSRRLELLDAYEKADHLQQTGQVAELISGAALGGKRWFTSWKLDISEQCDLTKDEQSFAVNVNRLAMLDSISFAMIIMNAIITAVSTDVQPHMKLWSWVEYVFLMYFIAELFIRLYVERVVRFFCGADRWWNLLDLLLVCLAIVDNVQELVEDKGRTTGVFTAMRVMRLLRVAKLIRLMRMSSMFREFLLMVKGILAVAPTLAWATVILAAVISILGMFARQTIGRWCDTEFDERYCPSAKLQQYSATLFSTVARSCFTVFRCYTEGCVAPDGTPLLTELLEMNTQGLLMVCFYTVSYIFVSFGLFNLILAVVVESTMQHARKAENQSSVNLLKAKKLRDLLLELARHEASPGSAEVSESLVITKEAFKQVLNDPNMTELLEDLEVPAASANSLFDTLDADNSSTLSVHELIEGIMRLQGFARNDVATLVRVKALQRRFDAIEQCVLQRAQR